MVQRQQSTILGSFIVARFEQHSNVWIAANFWQQLMIAERFIISESKNNAGLSNLPVLQVAALAYLDTPPEWRHPSVMHQRPTSILF